MRKTPGLTGKQKATYEWICDYVDVYRRSPTVREIMEGFCLKSTAPVQARLEQLRAKGYVDWEPGKNRTLWPLKRDVVSVVLANNAAEALLAFKGRCEDAGVSFADSLAEQLTGKTFSGNS